MSIGSGTGRYCAGCVNCLVASGRCPQCGWDDVSQAETHGHLPRHYLLLNRYYIGRVLGQGGFGVTYLARDLTLNHLVAIKEYLPIDQCARQTDRATVFPHAGERQQQYAYGLTRFLEEARSLATFENHPCIVPIINFAEANGTAYLVMAYLEGVTLKQYLASNAGRIPYPTAISLIMPVMDALREVHTHNLLHRDISPDNIFLTQGGQVKLLDFGAARYAVGEQSQNLSIILKQGYAPEEQYRSRGKQGAWTDVYATAATLYRCITGHLPPTAPDRVSEDDLVRPSVYCPALPLYIEAALLRGLAVRSADRFQTMSLFQQALLSPSTQASQPDVAPPPPPKPLQPSQPVPEPRQPQRPLLITLLVVALMIAGGLVWYAIASRSTAPISSEAITTPSTSDSIVSTPTESAPPTPSNTGGSSAGNSSQSGIDLQKMLESGSGTPPPAAPESKKSNTASAFLEEEQSNTAQTEQAAELWARMDQIFADASTKWAPNVIQITFDNRCNKSIRIATKFKVPDEEKWLTLGWRTVGAGQTIDTHYITRNQIIYNYAEALDGSSIWDGSDSPSTATEAEVASTFYAHGEGEPAQGTGQKKVSMFPETFTTWGTHAVVFTCQ